MKTMMIIFIAFTADNLDVISSDSRGGHELGQGNHGIEQVEIKRIENRNA